MEPSLVGQDDRIKQDREDSLANKLLLDKSTEGSAAAGFKTCFRFRDVCQMR